MFFCNSFEEMLRVLRIAEPRQHGDLPDPLAVDGERQGGRRCFFGGNYRIQRVI